jgi:hypothetical protein
MILRKVYVFIALFLLIPLVYANVDLPALADRIKTFAAQLEKIPSNAVAVDRLRAGADSLTSLRQRKRAINDIGVILQFLTVDERLMPTLRALIDEVKEAEAQLIGKPPLEVLKDAAMKYFSRLYPETGASIEFFSKTTGIQFGAKVTVNGVLYHIKTHRLGLSSGSHGSSSAAKPVDPVELFVYRFLEYSRCGPEAHFFWASEKDFYIATRDIGYSASGNVQVPYETVKDSFLGRKLKGSEVQIVEKGLSFFDIISRVFELSDLLTNSGNFFFIANKSGQIFDFKVIDFDPTYDEKSPKEESSRSTSPSTPKKGDGQGKSFAAYTPVKAGILTRISIDRRREFFTPMIGDILRAIEYAFQDIRLLQQTISSLDIASLERYVNSVANNLSTFLTSEIVVAEPIDVDSLKGYNRSVMDCVTVCPAESMTEININGRKFLLRDVPHDGDCGVWAVLLATDPEMEFNEEARAMILDLRRRATAIMPTPGQDVVPQTHEEEPPPPVPAGDAYTTAPDYDVLRERAILAMPGRFIGPEHLHFIGEILRVEIVIYDANHGRFQDTEGREILIEDAIAHVRTGGILLYYDENVRHFQVMEEVLEE